MTCIVSTGLQRNRMPSLNGKSGMGKKYSVSRERSYYNRAACREEKTSSIGWEAYWGEVLLPSLLVDKIVSQDLGMIESQG